jgi:3-oxoacyl-[acyl-carrier-protein] synthase II
MNFCPIQIRNSLVGIPGHILMYYSVYYKQRIAGEIKSFSTEGWVAGKFARRMDKFMLYLLTAGKKAVLDAGITEDKAKCGVLIGSAMGGMQVCDVLVALMYG